ncbi:MAG TPA: ferric reductase-like transmembrane domain-containing protein [Solirubrobacteraceae bacterium]|nr:ferric reductase-like transmembrane domain-containing protein [Solirubrobacteraceae bacterium]
MNLTLVHWYVIRASGILLLLLYSGATVLGLMNVSRIASPQWPRFVIDRVHRYVALLALVFLAIHILSTVTDSFVATPLVAVIIPFAKSYNTFWVGLGAAASDLMLAITITSIMRARVGARTWRAIHYAVYAAWPLAVLHGMGAGTDASSFWLIALNILCILAVFGALAVRMIAVPRLETV